MNLAEFQAAFQQAILADDDRLAPTFDETAEFCRKARIGVYIAAYRLRLAAVVAGDYPMLREALGEDAFEALTISYVEATQSSHANVRWYARDLPDFMAVQPRFRDQIAEQSLARFERALSDAFDAADAPVGSAEDLAEFGPETALRLQLEFHPSIRVLELTAGTTRAYESLCEGRSIESYGGDRELVLFWRQDGECFYRLIDDEEQFALKLAQDGYRFGELCQLLAFRVAGEDVSRRAAIFLSQWLADGLVSAIALDE